jgi:hypothetical protein
MERIDSRTNAGGGHRVPSRGEMGEPHGKRCVSRGMPFASPNGRAIGEATILRLETRKETPMIMNHPAELNLADIASMDRADLVEYIVSLRQFARIGGENQRLMEEKLASVSLDRLRSILYTARRIIHERGY